jgi:methylmalonyl-CoA/ethylmalonyl-CoA epimerase
MHAPVTGLSRISQIAMRARDTDRAVAFYSGALGLPLLFTAPPGLAFFDCDGIRLMLGPGEGEFDRPGSILYFSVDDIEQMHRLLVSRGVVFREAPHLVARLPDREVWVGVFDDTEGNTLALISEPAVTSPGAGA